MQYVNLGRTGTRVSRVCLGMMTYGSPRWREWMLDEVAARPIVQRAVELGVNFFDTADVYSAGESERITGKLVREYCRRDEAVVATKVMHPVLDDPSIDAPSLAPNDVPPNRRGLSRKHIMAAIDASLQRLGLDHVDLYQIHHWDDRYALDEMMETMARLQEEGKTRYIGVSNFDARQMAQALQIARFQSNQPPYNLIDRQIDSGLIPGLQRRLQTNQ